MIAALRALRINKTIVITFVCALILSLALVWVYSKAKAHSYSKLEPYALSFTIQQSLEPSVDNDNTGLPKNTESLITLAYDYGFGITKDHKRSLTIEETKANTTFEISLSAWKKIRGLHFIGKNNIDYRLLNLTISKAGNVYEFNSAELVPINEGNNITYRLPLSAWTH